MSKPVEVFSAYSVGSAANLIVALNKSKLKSFIRKNKNPNDRDVGSCIKELIKVFGSQPKRQIFNNALKKSRHYNAGNLQSLVNELRNGL